MADAAAPSIESKQLKQAQLRVSLVKVDVMIGAAVQAALKDASYAADWVKNSQTAPTELARQHYDMVLFDLGLPGKVGVEVLGRDRARDNSVPPAHYHCARWSG